MGTLVMCFSCLRHVRRNETLCPFCGVDVRAAIAASPGRPLPEGRLSRAALFAFAAASAAACGGVANTHTESDGSVGATNTGGGSETGGFPAGTGASAGFGATGGVSVPFYGAAFPIPGTGGVGAVSIDAYGAPFPYTGGAGGAGGADGGFDASVDSSLPDGAKLPDGGALDCFDDFAGGVPSRCCPDPAPDCANEPDGYPGYACTPAPRSYCSCSCSGGKWVCAC